jgi:hypothetical protein
MPTRTIGMIVIDQQVLVAYDGTGPLPCGATAWTSQRRCQVIVTGLIVTVPFTGLAGAVAMLWGHGIGLADVLLAAGLYTITGFCVTVGSAGSTRTAASRCPLPADRAGDRRFDEVSGGRDRLGRDPPAPPRLHRPPG